MIYLSDAMYGVPTDPDLEFASGFEGRYIGARALCPQLFAFELMKAQLLQPPAKQKQEKDHH